MKPTDRQLEALIAVVQPHRGPTHGMVYEVCLRLEDALRHARAHGMSPAEREAQRRSFVYGTTAISNHAVTQEMVNEIGDRFPAPHQRTQPKRDLSILWVLPVAALVLAALIAGAYAALPHRSNPRAHTEVPK